MSPSAQTRRLASSARREDGVLVSGPTPKQSRPAQFRHPKPRRPQTSCSVCLQASVIFLFFFCLLCFDCIQSGHHMEIWNQNRAVLLGLLLGSVNKTEVLGVELLLMTE